MPTRIFMIGVSLNRIQVGPEGVFAKEELLGCRGFEGIVIQTVEVERWTDENWE